MEIRKAYLSMIRAMAGGWDAMAAALGMSKASLENRVFERKQRMHVDTALHIQALSGTTYFAEAVARVSGGVFVPLPQTHHADREEIFDKQQELISEFGELLKEFRDFTSDGELDEREKQQLGLVADQIHRSLRELLSITFAVFTKPPKDEGAHASNRVD